MCNWRERGGKGILGDNFGGEGIQSKLDWKSKLISVAPAAVMISSLRAKR